MNVKEAIADIKKRPLTDFYNLERSPSKGKNMYICPICKSGTGKNKTGALHIKPSMRVECYASGCFGSEKAKSTDTLGALCILWNCEPIEALKQAGYMIEGGADRIQEKKEGAEQMQKAAEERKDYTSFFEACHKALLESEEAKDYLYSRGITSRNLIDRFNIGYCEAWKHSNSPNSRPTKRLIIPRNKNIFLARRIDQAKTEYEKQREKVIEGGEALFNAKVLEDKNLESIFVVEGEIDAISLYQAGIGENYNAGAIALGSISNKHLFIAEAKKHPEKVYILLLDNDGTEGTEEEPGTKGRGAQKELKEKLEEANLKYVYGKPENIYKNAKDANELLVKDYWYLKKLIEWAMEKAFKINEKEAAKDPGASGGLALLDSFLLEAQKSELYKPIPSGIADIDKALEGGFIRKTLVTLGAPPAMGKTCLAQWIFENMAASGKDVLYINLEMDRSQLLARSLSRLAWKRERKDISALEVLRGYAWSEEQKKTILGASEEYRKTIAAHFIYNPEGVSNTIDSLLEAMEKEAKRLEKIGREAPLVCIDYLQLIESGEKDSTEGMKKIIYRLKKYAIDYNTMVFLIIANNRAANKSGLVDMESGRDTSAIEYSGDIMLGLSYTAIEDHRTYKEDKGKSLKEYNLETIRSLKKEAYDKGEALPSVCTEITIKVIKSRFTDSERRAKLIFDGKHSTYNQVEKWHTTAKAWEDIGSH